MKTPAARPHDRQEQGALSVFAVITTLVVILFFGAIVDFGRKLQARQDANIAAEEAARAGAGQVDRDRAYAHGGSFTIDRQAAIRAARNYLHTGGYTGSVTGLGTHRIRVRVQVERPAIFLPLIGIHRLRADAIADADLATGIQGENQ